MKEESDGKLNGRVSQHLPNGHPTSSMSRVVGGGREGGVLCGEGVPKDLVAVEGPLVLILSIA